jgi:hypothetical protein
LGGCDYAGHGGVGNLFAVVVAASLFPEGSFNLFHGVRSGGVKGEQLPRHGALALLKMICRNCYWQMCRAGEMEQFYWRKGLFCLLQTYLRARATSEKSRQDDLEERIKNRHKPMRIGLWRFLHEDAV